MITHIFIDGTVARSIAGMTIPYTPATAPVFQIAADLQRGGGKVDRERMGKDPEEKETAAAAAR